MSSEGAGLTGFSPRLGRMAGLVLALVAGAVAVFFCFTQVESRRAEVLDEYRLTVQNWLSGASAALEIWTRDSKALRLRVSSAETYRIFAGDYRVLDPRSAARVDEGDASGLSENAQSLAEEAPAIRRILLDFMNYNGLQDARLVSGEGHTLLSALSAPVPLTREQAEAASECVKNGRTVVLPVRGTTGGLVLDVLEPVFDVEVKDRCVAAFLSTMPVLGPMAQVLGRPKKEELAVAVMLQRHGKVWERMRVPEPVPLPDGLRAELDSSSGSMPFGPRDSVNKAGEPVYSMSLFVPDLNWSIVHETPASVIEGVVSRATLFVYIEAALGWFLCMAVGGLLWWMGVGRHQGMVAHELRRLNRLVSRQKELLDSVNISLDVGIVMVDIRGKIRVCNRAMAGILERAEKDLADQMLFAVLPAETASQLLDRIRQVAISGKADGCELTLDREGEPRLYRVTLFPFLDTGEFHVRQSIRGAVITMKDITEFRRHSERLRQQQHSLIEAFIRAEESVDPYLVGHSERMSRLAELVAASMGLDEDGTNTVVMGALLSQVGKLFIPRELLTKEGRLTPDELREVRRAPEHAFRLLEKVDFDLPIGRALHEMYECMDGSGYPQGLREDEILPEARILAVLNAFCAMVSARSYHSGMSGTKALEELEASPRFDQTVVAHLRSVLETPEGALAART